MCLSPQRDGGSLTVLAIALARPARTPGRGPKTLLHRVADAIRAMTPIFEYDRNGVRHGSARPDEQIPLVAALDRPVHPAAIHRAEGPRFAQSQYGAVR